MKAREILLYQPLGEAAPLYAFLEGLDPRLREKLLWQIFRLAVMPEPDMREPHIKHFSLEKYRQFYELREKNKILVRIVFTIWNGDILLLAPFVKKQSRDTMRALEQSAKMLSTIRENPECVIKFDLAEEVWKMKKE